MRQSCAEKNQYLKYLISLLYDFSKTDTVKTFLLGFLLSLDIFIKMYVLKTKKYAWNCYFQLFFLSESESTQTVHF